MLIRRLLRYSLPVLLSCVAGHLLAQQKPSNHLPSSEHQALVAVYKGTGGPQWTEKSGWLGPPGTECEWRGVTCLEIRSPGGEAVPSVWSLDLAENNLVGTVPPEIGALKNLGSLYLFGNRLTGTLPDSLIQRWIDGLLDISAEAHLFTTITMIDYEWSSSVLCPQRRVTLDSTGSAFVYTTRCRNQTPDDRTTYCDVEQGELYRGEFARLALTIEKSGFFQLKPEYSRSVTHGVFENIRVIRAGTAIEVSNYADAGPLELWGIQRAIQGVTGDMEVQKKSRLEACPKRVPK